MDIQAEKSEIMRQFKQINDLKLIREIKKLINNATQEKKVKKESKKPISAEKQQKINQIKEAVEELNLIKQGKLKGIPVKDLLDEL